MLTTILNVTLWIWVIEVVAGVLVYCVALGKSIMRRDSSVRYGPRIADLAMPNGAGSHLRQARF
jgi:hypothetical protein